MSEHTFEVTDANFQNEVIRSGTPVLVDFWAEWCGPCKMVEPIVEELAKKYEGKLRVGKLDIEAQPNVPQLFGVQGIPTLILFKDGEPVQQIVGFRGRDQLDTAISKHLALSDG
jgi:thioredoxin 1